jgi:hypothetical protein
MAGISVAAAIAVAAGCGSPADPTAAYLSEARSTGKVPATMNDVELLTTGRLICAAPPEADPALAFGETPQEIVDVARRHCADALASTSETVPASAPAAAPPTPDALKLGRRFDVPDSSGGAVIAQVAITDIQVDPTCTTKYGTVNKAKNGHYIAVKLDVQTQQNFDASSFGYPTGYDFSVTGPDGYTQGQVYADGLCIADRDTFGTPMVASSKYRGWVLIDSPATQGTLTFRPHFNTTWAGATIPIPASGTGSAPAEPPHNTSTSNGIGETDYPAMRAHIKANNGQPSSPAESQYLYACQTHVLPAEQCP